MKIKKAILTLNSSQVSLCEDTSLLKIDTRALLITTLLYIVFVLLVPLETPDKLIWFAVYPIIMSPLYNLNYSNILKKSFYVLPFIVFIGIFNPFYDKREAFQIGGVIISYGWITFLSIILRGLLTTQAIVILITAGGFINICNALVKLRVPKVFSTQLLLVYRYLGILLEESFNMHRAVTARGFGKKSFPLKMWVNIVGSLLIRTFERSKRIYNAMLARGFNGTIPFGKKWNWTIMDSLFCFIWIIVFFLLYTFNLSNFIK